jgi:Ca2+-binding RTX toxin-like protein
MMFAAFAALARGTRERGHSGPPRFAPRLQSLDPRIVPAVTAAFNANTGVLTVLGDAADNAIDISRDAAGNIVVNGGAVAVTGGTPTVANTTLVKIDGKAGDDTIRMVEANGALPAAAIDGGDGDDILDGGSGADTFFGGAGDDTIIGRRGNDTAHMGAGDDVFVWFPGDGSDVVEGGAGFDRMDFVGSNANETFDVTANGRRVTFFRNVGTIVMDLNQVERIDLDALGGADTVTLNNVRGTDLREFNIDLGGVPGGGAGDGAADAIVLNGTNTSEVIGITGANGSVAVTGLPVAVNIRRMEEADALRVNANGGNDVISAVGLTTPMGLTMDGGAGGDQMFGSALNETFIGGAGNDFVDGNRGDDIAFLGAGNDIFQWDPGDGNDAIEGGSGRDEMLFNGAGANETVDISANGGRLRFFRTPGNVLMDTDEVEVVTFNALGGADTVTVNDLSGTDVKLVRINLGSAIGSATPDGRQDRVVVNGTAGDDVFLIGARPGEAFVQGPAVRVEITGLDPNALDLLFVNGLDGADRFNAQKVIPNVIGLTTTD